MKRVLALTIRPKEAADTRYRILEYIPWLKEAGIEVEHQSLLNAEFFQKQQRGCLGAGEIAFFASSFLKRVSSLMSRLPYDAVWLARELFPYGPPLLERLLFRQDMPVILDIDDAIFEPDPAGNFWHKTIRDFNKYEYIAPRCRATVVGSRYLADYFSCFTNNLSLIPTCVDHEKYAAIQPHSRANRLSLGWIGTSTNQAHVERLQRPIERLARRYPLEFRAVGLNKDLNWDMEHAYAIPWVMAEELNYFSQFDIGLMPLVESHFTKGKCAFKLVQYMAAGIPCVASPVGANCETIVEGEQGFLAETDEEWEKSLETLILDENLRRKMGQSGRRRVREHYSFAGHWRKYADILLS